MIGIDRHGNLEPHHVSPVPFVVRQPPEIGNTPSIKSTGSELDDTSPLFEKSLVAVKKPAHPDKPPRSISKKSGSVRKPENSLDVWRDVRSDAKPDGKPRLRRKPGMVFKDVSNTRQLLCDDQRTGLDQDPVKGNQDIDRTHKDAQRIPYLQPSVPHLQPILTSSYTETHRQPQKHTVEPPWAPSRDLVRAVHIAATLAALEGRVAPKSGTPEPLIRCARQEYGPDVLLEWGGAPPLFHPKPIRPWIGKKTIQSLEKQVASTDSMSGSTLAGPQMRPCNPAPGLMRPRAARHLAAKGVVGKQEKQAGSGSRTRTCFPVEMRPQMRPSNPSPYSARNR